MATKIRSLTVLERAEKLRESPEVWEAVEQWAYGHYHGGHEQIDESLLLRLKYLANRMDETEEVEVPRLGHSGDDDEPGAA